MSEVQTTNNKPLIIALIVVLVLVLCCCLVVAGLGLAGVLTLPWSGIAAARVGAGETLDKTFDVSTPLNLVVDVNVGDIIIETGPGNEVHISAQKRVWGTDRRQAEAYLGDFEVRISQPDTDVVEIKTETPPRLRHVSRAPSVDLEITVPRDTNLDLAVNVGSVEISDVRGGFGIESNVGDVTLRGVRLEEDSQISSDVGDLELRLPADSAFSFRAESNVGDIRIDFPVRNEESEKRVVGGRIEGEIGDSPVAHVRLRTNTGSIQIRRGD